jgi:hypothetical protein
VLAKLPTRDVRTVMISLKMFPTASFHEESIGDAYPSILHGMDLVPVQTTLASIRVVSANAGVSISELTAGITHPTAHTAPAVEGDHESGNKALLVACTLSNVSQHWHAAQPHTRPQGAAQSSDLRNRVRSCV